MKLLETSKINSLLPRHVALLRDANLEAQLPLRQSFKQVIPNPKIS
jgi:hypothetical protein